MVEIRLKLLKLTSLVHLKILMHLTRGIRSIKVNSNFAYIDWISVIGQLHCPKQLSHRHFEFLKSRFVSGIPENIELIC